VLAAKRTATFTESVIREMTRIASMHQAVNLAQGFPDFSMPDLMKDAACAAINGDINQYAVTWGAPVLRQAIAEKYRRWYGMEVDADRDVTVTCGATEAMATVFMALMDAGDEVIIPEPFYENYGPDAILAGAKPVFVPFERPNWTLDPDRLRKTFNAKTKAIIVNTPHNPTGKVYSRAELEAIAGLCREHDAVCITDEVYEHLVFDGEHVPMASLPGMRERTITISSFGKTFSLTGWKIGWAAAAPELTAAVRAAHQFITFATATPLQHGAAVALAEAGPGYYGTLLSEYRARRDFLVRELSRIGFAVRPPAGAYFVAADFRAFSDADDRAFVRRLIEEVGVAAIPPSVFYADPERRRPWVRFAFCKKMETLEAAVDRLQRLRVPA